jgi:hypothetical protein
MPAILAGGAIVGLMLGLAVEWLSVGMQEPVRPAYSFVRASAENSTLPAPERCGNAGLIYLVIRLECSLDTVVAGLE